MKLNHAITYQVNYKSNWLSAKPKELHWILHQMELINSSLLDNQITLGCWEWFVSYQNVPNYMTII